MNPIPPNTGYVNPRNPLDIIYIDSQEIPHASPSSPIILKLNFDTSKLS